MWKNYLSCSKETNVYNENKKQRETVKRLVKEVKVKEWEAEPQKH